MSEEIEANFTLKSDEMGENNSKNGTKTSMVSQIVPKQIIVTPPTANDRNNSSDTFEVLMAIESTSATTTAAASKHSESKLSRFRALRESFRLMRPIWTRKSIPKRRRSKSVGAEISEVISSRSSSSELNHRIKHESPYVDLDSSRRKHGLRLKVGRIFHSFRHRSKSGRKECSSCSDEDSDRNRKPYRKRSRSLDEVIDEQVKETCIYVDSFRFPQRKRSQSVTVLQIIDSKNEANLSQIECNSSEVFLSVDKEYSNAIRRRSLSLNDISAVESSTDYETATNTVKTSKKEPLFRRALTLTKLSIRKYKSRKRKAHHSNRPQGSSSSEVMGQKASTSSGTVRSNQNIASVEGSNYQREIAKVSGKKWRDEKEELIVIREELLLTKRQLYDRDQQLLKLHREIHKLKSVLEQQQQHQSKDQQLPKRSESPQSSAPTKKRGVSGESVPNSTVSVVKIEKDFRSRQLIKEALLDNTFLQNSLDSHQLKLIIDAMYEKEFAKGTLLCEQGTFGSHLYVIAYGHCQILTDNEPVNTIGPGKAFGELAILYNCARTATVKALTKVRVWVLDRRVFHAIMVKTGKDRRLQYKTFLKSVHFLQNLSDEQIAKIVDSIEVETFSLGEYICRQGCHGDSFYIISQGSVKVTQECRTEKSNEIEEKLIRILQKGDFFGEQALQGIGSMRTANVISEGCECLVLDRESFHSLLGDLNEIKEKRYENDFADLLILQSQESGIEENSYANINLNELDVIGTLGIGGFGRVDLVRYIWDKSKVFALKSCSKAFICSTQQENHINNERIVQKIACRHQFITKLYRTYKDANFVYFLMEASLGGELWTLLRNRGSFEECVARFYIACVVEALQYLHSQQIIYRDLKPENCLLDASGFLKLTDFGFSKILGSGEKTWTFCGTPEYVAPEIILNRGHDFAVDFWSIGILLYELLTGLPPFQSTDPLKTYNIILRGFDAIGFDEKLFSKYAINFIRRLCRENPSERLGVQKNGFLDIKRHKWFAGYDWNAMVKRTMKPPIVPLLDGPTDMRYFDSSSELTLRTDFEADVDEGEYDESIQRESNWDKDF